MYFQNSKEASTYDWNQLREGRVERREPRGARSQSLQRSFPLPEIGEFKQGQFKVWRPFKGSLWLLHGGWNAGEGVDRGKPIGHSCDGPGDRTWGCALG